MPIDKIKLSKTQKELVLQMRQGYTMMKNVTYVFLSESFERPSIATFFALGKRGLIKPVGKFIQGKGQVYELSEYGETVSIL